MAPNQYIEGTRLLNGGVIVTVAGKLLEPFPSQAVHNHSPTGCLREGAKSYAKPAPARRRGPSTPVQEARTFWPCSRNWPCGPTYL